jgi:hypothetical protein
MLNEEHPSDALGQHTPQPALVQGLKSHLRKIDEFSRRWYVRYLTATINLIAAFGGIVYFFRDIPRAIMMGDYMGPPIRLLFTILPAGLGIWIDGRQTYVSALKDLAAFCRGAMPVLAGRLADILTKEAKRVEPSAGG